MVETCSKEPQWLKVGTGIESPEVPTGSRKVNGTTQNFSFVFNMYLILISKWKLTINVMVTCLRLIASLLNKGGWPLLLAVPDIRDWPWHMTRLPGWYWDH
jgi:hypothetical protein